MLLKISLCIYFEINMFKMDYIKGTIYIYFYVQCKYYCINFASFKDDKLLFIVYSNNLAAQLLFSWGIQREMGHWPLYYTSPQSFKITFSYSTIMNVQMFQPQIVIYRRGIFCVLTKTLGMYIIISAIVLFRSPGSSRRLSRK